jgi:signal transduction histidine kinase
LLPRTLTQKIILSFLLVSLAGIALVAVITRLSTIREFDTLLVNQAKSRIADLAAGYYEANGTWDGFDVLLRQNYQDLIQPRNGFPYPAPVGEAVRRLSPILLADLDGKVVFPGERNHPDEFVSKARLQSGTQVVVNGATIGFIVASGEQPGRDAFQEQYVKRTTRNLLLAGAGAGLLALILGVVLAQSLTQPLQELKDATQAMSRGQLGRQVPIRTRDELGELAESFNTMSVKLAHENQLRRQMTADIAHDLRTPLSVLSGYIEAMRDGVLKPQPERFETMYHEIEHLKHLVEDLRTLSLADAGELPLQLQPLQPGDLLKRAQEFFRHPAELLLVELSVEVEQGLPDLMADVERMMQVMENIISNALRYSQPGEAIELKAAAREGGVVLIVQDHGKGISPEDLPNIFNRFYRGDKARSVDQEESGLGLAIARAIVQAHGGEISVESKLGAGTTFTIYLPQSA